MKFAMKPSPQPAHAIYVPLLITLPSVATLVVFWYGARQVISGQLELGDLISFMFFIGLLIWPLQLIGELTAQWKRAVASAARPTTCSIKSHKSSTCPVRGSCPGVTAKSDLTT